MRFTDPILSRCGLTCGLPVIRNSASAWFWSLWSCPRGIFVVSSAGESVRCVNNLSKSKFHVRGRWRSSATHVVGASTQTHGRKPGCREVFHSGRAFWNSI